MLVAGMRPEIRERLPGPRESSRAALKEFLQSRPVATGAPKVARQIGRVRRRMMLTGSRPSPSGGVRGTLGVTGTAVTSVTLVTALPS